MEKQEIIDKIQEKVPDKELQIDLLESIVDEPQKEEMISKAEYDKLLVDYELLQKKYEDLQDKYISRFGDAKTDVPNDVVDEERIEEEKEVVNVDSIF